MVTYLSVTLHRRANCVLIPKLRDTRTRLGEEPHQEQIPHYWPSNLPLHTELYLFPDKT